MDAGLATASATPQVKCDQHALRWEDCVNSVGYVIMVEPTQLYISGNRQSFTIWRFLVFFHGRYKKLSQSFKPRSKINYLALALQLLRLLRPYRTPERIHK
jgi:hypothetical protein